MDNYVNRDIDRVKFFSLVDKEYTSEEMIYLGESAAEILSSVAFQHFIRIRTNELYEEFLKLNPRSKPEDAADVIHRQNILSDLVSHMRYLKQAMETIGNKNMAMMERGRGGKNGKEEEDQGDGTQGNGERERILGISGSPEGV